MTNFLRVFLSIYFAFLLILFPITLYKILQGHTILGTVNEVVEGWILIHFFWIAPAVIATALVNIVSYRNYKKVFLISLLIQAVLFYFLF